MGSSSPYVSPELIEFLNSRYPLRSPGLDDEDRKIWFNVGARSVVEHLIRLHSQQVKADLGS